MDDDLGSGVVQNGGDILQNVKNDHGVSHIQLFFIGLALDVYPEG